MDRRHNTQIDNIWIERKMDGWIDSWNGWMDGWTYDNKVRGKRKRQINKGGEFKR